MRTNVIGLAAMAILAGCRDDLAHHRLQRKPVDAGTLGALQMREVTVSIDIGPRFTVHDPDGEVRIRSATPHELEAARPELYEGLREMFAVGKDWPLISPDYRTEPIDEIFIGVPTQAEFSEP